MGKSVHQSLDEHGEVLAGDRLVLCGERQALGSLKYRSLAACGLN
jgi:hypothetical protein